MNQALKIAYIGAAATIISALITVFVPIICSKPAGIGVDDATSSTNYGMWSDWSTIRVDASDTCEVQTRESNVYRMCVCICNSGECDELSA